MTEKDFSFHPYVEEEKRIFKEDESYIKKVVKRYFQKKKYGIALCLMCIIVLLAIFAPLFSSYKYTDIITETVDGVEVAAGGLAPQIKSASGSSAFDKYTFLFGTDELGRDLWSRVWTGTRISLVIAVISIVINVIVGTSYGLISGYSGGMIDSFMQRFIEIIDSIPSLVMVAVLAIFVPKGVGLVLVMLILIGWIDVSRIARAGTMRVKNLEYVMASRTMGASDARIIFRTILPNILGPIVTQIIISVPTAIFVEAFLSFVGVGIIPPDCSLGSLIQNGFENVLSHPYQIIMPVMVLALLMISFNYIGEGIEYAFDSGKDGL